MIYSMLKERSANEECRQLRGIVQKAFFLKPLAGIQMILLFSFMQQDYFTYWLNWASGESVSSSFAANINLFLIIYAIEKSKGKCT